MSLRTTQFVVCTAALFGFAILAGCDRSTAPADTPASLADIATPSADETSPTADAASPTHPAVAAAFSPPFPERTELFEPPKRAQGMVRRDLEFGETVELKGFITVDEPRVILAIGDQIAPIPEGSEKYGVQVISIDPPSAVLQRGRTRWTATLE